MLTEIREITCTELKKLGVRVKMIAYATFGVDNEIFNRSILVNGNSVGVEITSRRFSQILEKMGNGAENEHKKDEFIKSLYNIVLDKETDSIVFVTQINECRPKKRFARFTILNDGSLVISQ